jgi:tetratricopeptide (TPR) repeat protein
MSEPATEVSEEPDTSYTTADQSLSLGDSYYVDENYTEAIDAYAAALSVLKSSECLQNFRALSHRSAAFYQLERYEDALLDAQAAAKLLSSGTPISGLRPGETEMCSRKEGLAAFQLGRYQYAQAALESAAQLALLNQRDATWYDKWIRKCQEHQPTKTTTTTSQSTTAPPERSPPAAAPAPIPPLGKGRPPTPKYQYYQSDKVMTIQIIEPNVRSEDLRVEFEPKRLTVVLSKGGFDLTVIAGKLYDEVDVDHCRVQIKDEKVLIKLRKATAAQHEWHELMGKETIFKTPSEIVPAPEIKELDKDKARPYTSHRDWNEIEKAVVAEEASEQPQGDEAANKLFQQIYANADEDTKRAMIKSYQTSGGTVLSTNWSEVGTTDYEKKRTAPKGMEWKTWEGDKVAMEEEE